MAIPRFEIEDPLAPCRPAAGAFQGSSVGPAPRVFRRLRLAMAAERPMTEYEQWLEGQGNQELAEQMRDLRGRFHAGDLVELIDDARAGEHVPKGDLPDEFTANVTYKVYDLCGFSCGSRRIPIAACGGYLRHRSPASRTRLLTRVYSSQ